MTPERWQELKTVLAAALERKPQERPAYLDQVCAEPSLRRELESLIAAHEQGDSSFMERPPVESGMLEHGAKLGPYEILGPLGAGGMGEVYQAHDTKLGRNVAIKVLPEAFAHDLERLSRFQREAKMLASLNHPNIATIHGFEQSDGVHYLVMELVAGQTLAERLGRGALGIEEALRIGYQITEALEAAHEKGVIHRDLKPGNVKVTPEGRVKVLDFGLAKAFAGDDGQDLSNAPTLTAMGTEEGRILGTPSYMSPEQARGKAVDKRTDIWAFGCVLYELLTGRRMFRGETLPDTLAAVLEREPEWQALPASTPAKIRDLLRRCSQKDPQRRLRDLGDARIEIGEALTVAATGGPSEKRDTDWGRAALSSPGPSAQPQPRWRNKAALWIPAVAVMTLVLGLSYKFAGRGETIESLAVLPFVNASGDPNAEYLSDGITESLINSLSQLPHLRVMSRDSAFMYKGKETDARTVGQALGVRSVFKGRVMQRGDNLAISAELVDARDNSHIWGEQYTRDPADLSTLQNDLTREITAALRMRLTGEEEKRMAKSYTANPEAYQDYLKGRYWWNKRTEEGLNKGIEYFQRAIDKDPTSPRAYTGLADSYNALGSDRFLPPIEVFPRAKAAALEALRMDQNFAEAHASLAFAIWNYDYDWKAVETEYKRAIELNPGYATSYHWYAGYLLGMGRFAEAIAAVKKARELDPLSPRINANVGFVLYFARQYDQAIEELQKALRLDPNSEAPYYYLGLVYLQKGNYREAIAGFEKSKQLLSGGGGSYLNLAQAYALAGERKEAQIILNRSLAEKNKNYESALLIAEVYAALDEKAKAFAWLQKAYGERSSLLPFLGVDPTLDVLHSDPRFQALLTRMQLQR